MFSIAVASGKFGSAERMQLTSRIVDKIVKRREALNVLPAPNMPWTHSVVCPERRP